MPGCPNTRSVNGDTLLARILANPVLRKRFVVQIPGTGREELNVMACREWVGDLADVEASLGLYKQYAGGGTLRGTELGSLLARNTDFWVRNLMGMGQYVSVIRQYDKTSNTVQADCLIPIAFSVFAADLIIQIHTFARPLARLFAKLIWPNHPEVSALYGEMLFMDDRKELTTDHISHLMAGRSCGILSWRMTIQPHRHINIAFRRKHCRAETETLEGKSGRQ
jgi:bloom syndrome protein